MNEQQAETRPEAANRTLARLSSLSPAQKFAIVRQAFERGAINQECLEFLLGAIELRSVYEASDAR